MNWSQKALDALDLFIKDVSPDRKERVKHYAIQEIEEYCRTNRIREVGYDQVVIGYIRSVPSHQRLSLKNTLRVKGVPVEKYEGHFMSVE